jgi:uncharacterized repeat protein (TIGR03803 family)
VSGTLYDTTQYGGARRSGIVYAIDEAPGAEKIVYSFCGRSQCKDGQYPDAGLISVKGILYGTTEEGGDYNAGTVYSFDPSTGAETAL